MPVVVVSAARDDRDAWPGLLEQARESLIGRPVMRDLEDLHGRWVERQRHQRLCIRGQEHVDAPVRRDEHRCVQIRVLVRRRCPGRPEDAEPQASQSEDEAGSRSGDREAGSVTREKGPQGSSLALPKRSLATKYPASRKICLLDGPKPASLPSEIVNGPMDSAETRAERQPAAGRNDISRASGGIGRPARRVNPKP